MSESAALAVVQTYQPIQSVLESRYNAPLIAQAAKLWVKPEDIVLDPTWGRGNFYKDWKPENLIAHDLYTLDGVDYRALPEEDRSVDVVIFDPPYVTGGTVTTSTIPEMLDRYGTGASCPRSIPELFEMNRQGMAECARVLKPGGRLMVKTMDYICNGKFIQGHHFVVTTAEELGLEQVDEFVHYSGTGPQPKFNLDGSPRRQVHSRRAHSFLCVFRKPMRLRSV